MTDEWAVRTTGLQELIDDLKNEAPGVLDQMADVAVTTTAEAIRRDAVEGLVSGRGEWAPLHPFTVAQKGGDQPLVASGSLRDSLAVWHEGSVAFVGVPPGETRSDGTSMEEVAEAMENGRVVAVTPAIRADLASKGLVLRQDTLVLIIPSRPFLAPAADFVDQEPESLLDPAGDVFSDWWEGSGA